MDIIKSYKDLCNEIEAWKWRVEAYKAEIKALKKMAKIYGPSKMSGIDYTQPAVQGSGQLAFEDYLIRLRKIENHIYIHEEAIEGMIKSRDKIKEKMEEWDELEKKVIYMRDVEKKSLVDISKELDYSYQYIKEISAKNK